MNKKKIAIIISIIVLTALGILILQTGRRTDVYLKDFEVSRDGKTITLSVGTTSSTGYIRKMKKTDEGENYYLTFYSTFGINSKIKNIIDKTKEIKDFSCDSALEKFYEDDNYNYFFNCIKGEYMIVGYKDGSKETIEEALKNKNITISDLDLYEIDYYKEHK